jgi:hypothetical protein
MAKQLSDKVLEDVRVALRNGTGLPDGVCLDFARDPYAFPCSDVEERTAQGEVSVSFDGTQILDLKTGEVKEGKPIDRSMPVTLMEMADASGGGTPATTNADTQTTDNAPAGGRRR